ncbi:MAG TPA: alpha/beta hydrolase [Burkholderiales bacterium]
MIAPQDFPTQPPPGSPEAARYAEAVTAATRKALSKRNPPERVAYGADPAQRLDVYAGKGKSPVLLFFHGGAWISGYLWWCGFMALGVERQGGLLVAGTYRLAPAHRFPAQLDDVKAALQWVRANIARYGGDPERIVVGGHSAGGHLAALACLEQLPPAGARACFPLCSPLDIHYPDCQPGSPEERVYKFLLPRREDDVAASPVTHVERARIPFHLEYGERDFARIVQANVKFDGLMKKFKKTHSVRIVAGADHFSTHLGLRNPAAPWFADLGKAFHAA